MSQFFFDVALSSGSLAPSSTPTSTSSSTSSFSIKVKLDNQVWKVERSKQQCLEFMRKTLVEFTDADRSEIVASSDDEACDITADDMKALFTNIYSDCSNSLTCAALFAFLDELEQTSWFTRSHIRLLEAKINGFAGIISDYEARLQKFEQIVNSSTSAKSESNPSGKSLKPDADKDEADCFSMVKEESQELLVGDLLEAKKNWDDLSLSREDTGNSSATIPEDSVDESILNSVFSADILLAVNSEGFPLDGIPEACLHSFFGEVDLLLRAVQPHEMQLQYRTAAVNYIRRQSRIALGCLTFEFGLHSINCFLPTDPIKVTLPLAQNLLPHWHATLSERLKNLSEGNLSVPKSTDVTLTEDNPEDMTDLFQGTLRNINVVPDASGPMVTFQFESIECQVICNNRIDLCNVTFLQEFSNLVGKDNLFKRSLLLIRSWWDYESSSYVGIPMKPCLSENCLAFMLVSIFNNYHDRVNHPFEAYVLFLREFSSWDCRTHAISMQGIVPFHSDTSHQPCLVRPQPHHLMNNELLEKYWQAFNPSDSFNSEFAGVTNRNQNHRQIMMLNSMNKAIVGFERCGYNIIHPFLNNNLVTENSHGKRLVSITKVFQLAYSNLNSLLEHIKLQYHSLNVNATIAELMRRLLPSVYSRFTNHFRPDAVGNSVYLQQFSSKEYSDESHHRDLLNTPTEKLWENVTYSNFIVENLISEAAVLTFCSDTLTVKGPLPAGELGKLLSEASSIANLSHKLREKFGGLKKFLERYPDKFIFSNDHPFNPHVLLRSAISAENLELIDRGIFPIHLISKSARAAAAAAAKKQSAVKGSPPTQVITTSPGTNFSVNPSGLVELNNGGNALHGGYQASKNASVATSSPKVQYGNYYPQRSANVTYGNVPVDPFAPNALFSGAKGGYGGYHGQSAASQSSARLRNEYYTSKAPSYNNNNNNGGRFQPESIAVKDAPRHFAHYSNANSNTDKLGGGYSSYSLGGDSAQAEEFGNFSKLGPLNQTSGSMYPGLRSSGTSHDYFSDNKNVFHNNLKLSEDNLIYDQYRSNNGPISTNEFNQNQQSFDGPTQQFNNNYRFPY